jgi:hypothetical protein
MMSWKSSASVAFSLLSLTGCYSMQPYGMHPGMYSPGVPAQRVPLPPRQTIIMPSQPAPTPILTTPSSAPSSTFAPGTSSMQAPPVRQSPGPSSAEKTVPLPRDPGAEATPEDNPPDRTSNSKSEMGFIPPIRTKHEFGLNEFGRSIPESSSERQLVQSPTIARAGSVRLQSVENDGGQNEINQVVYQNLTSHHPEFEWIQGALQYDSARRAWHLMYDTNPGRDQWGGELQLTGYLPFEPSDHNKLFRVYGRTHSKLMDRLNKPQYEVREVERITPTNLEQQ